MLRRAIGSVVTRGVRRNRKQVECSRSLFRRQHALQILALNNNNNNFIAQASCFDRLLFGSICSSKPFTTFARESDLQRIQYQKLLAELDNIINVDGDLDGAEMHLQKYIQEHPNSPVGYIASIMTKIATKNRQKALQVALDWHAQSATDYSNYGAALACLHTDQPQRALEYVNNIVDPREDMWTNWQPLKAQICIACNDFKSAVENIDEAIANDPGNAEYYKVKARAHILMGEHAQAEKTFKKLIHFTSDVTWLKELFRLLLEHKQFERVVKLTDQYADKQDIEGLDEFLLAHFKGVALLQLGQIEEAAELLEEVQEKGELPTESQALLVEVYMSAKPPQLEDAKNLLEGLIVDEPKESKWWQKHAMISAQLSKTEDAIKSMKRAVELNPTNPKLWLDLAAIIPATDLKQKQEALEQYSKSGGNSVIAHLVAAEISAKQNKIADVRRQLAIAERVNKTSREMTQSGFLKTIQALYASIGDYSSQAMTLEELLASSDPQDKSDAERLLIDTYVNWEKYDDAMDMIDTYLKSDRSDVFDVLMLKAVCLRKMGDIEKAQKQLSDPRLEQETFPKSKAKLLFERAMIQLSSTEDPKSLAKAIDYLRQATDVDPEFATGWDYLTRCLLRQIEDIGKTPNALEIMEEVCDMHVKINNLDPTNLEAWLRRASLHLTMGQRDQARACLKHVLSVNPNHRRALRLKKDCDDFKMTKELQEELKKFQERKAQRANAKANNNTNSNVDPRRQQERNYRQNPFMNTIAEPMGAFNSFSKMRK